MINCSSWIRPAQAIIQLESGEMRDFPPPRNRGSLPRALTFGDQQQEDEDITNLDLATLKYNVDDPPEEYESFEQEHSINDNDISVMSTPTEQYSNLLRTKKSTSCYSPLSQSKNHDRPTDQFCSSLQLMTFDIHLMMQQLERLFDEDDTDSDWICVPVEELNSLLINCCKENREYVMIEE